MWTIETMGEKTPWALQNSNDRSGKQKNNNEIQAIEMQGLGQHRNEEIGLKQSKEQKIGNDSNQESSNPVVQLQHSHRLKQT